MISSQTKEIRLEDQIFFPAQVDGDQLVYKNPDFQLVRRSWQPDESAQTCCICKTRFGGLKRRHHCRQCGRVVCNKCCSEKMMLPHYGFAEPERVCDPCKPVADVIIKARSETPAQQYAAAQTLAELCKDPGYIVRLFSYGGFHTILSLAKQNLSKNSKLMHLNHCISARIVSCLHTLSTNEPLLNFMVEEGTITALCDILDQTAMTEEDLLLDGVNALVIFCRSNRFKMAALEAGTLPVILKLCGNPNEKVALIALTCLSAVVEKRETHRTIVDDDRQALPSLVSLAKSDNSQLQGIALKCLTNVSLGSDWNKHRIVQEDFSAGKILRSVLLSGIDNMQVLCNTACLIANLATSQEDQAALSGSLDAMIQMLQSDISNIDLLNNVTRGLANFSRYQQNLPRLKIILPDVLKYCLRHHNKCIVRQGLRVVFNLLSMEPEQISNDLSREGADLIVQLLAEDKAIIAGIKAEIMKQVSDLNTPL